jgi:hypothetical protein
MKTLDEAFASAKASKRAWRAANGLRAGMEFDQYGRHSGIPAHPPRRWDSHFSRERSQRRKLAAVKTCAQRWFAAGRTGKIVIPEIGKDLNDELRAAGR